MCVCARENILVFLCVVCVLCVRESLGFSLCAMYMHARVFPHMRGCVRARERMFVSLCMCVYACVCVNSRLKVTAKHP